MERRRSVAVWSAVIVLIAGVFLVGGFLTRNSVSSSFDTNAEIRSARHLLFETVKDQLDEETGIRGYAATGDPQFLQPYVGARTALAGTELQLETQLGDLHMGPSVDAAKDAVTTNSIWLLTVAHPLLGPHQRESLTVERNGKVLVDRFRIDAARIDSGLSNRDASLKGDFERELSYIGALIIGAAVLFIAVGWMFLTMQTRAWESLEKQRRQSEAAELRAAGLQAAYRAEKRIADALQSAISQRDLPGLPSMRFSATYTPATEETKVGGDWYDAFELGPHRILFTIGDIAGHGIDAAVAMSRIRNSVLAAALLESDSASILERVNREIVQRGEGPMVTAVVGIANWKTFEFEYSSAGHPPPVLLEPGRQPKFLEFGSLPLGVDENATYRTHRIQSVPGATLVLYTDGAIEHSRDVIKGERMLLDAIATVPQFPEAEPAMTIFRTIFDGIGVADDVAILTIGFTTKQPTGLQISAEDATTSLAGYVARTQKEKRSQGLGRKAS